LMDSPGHKANILEPKFSIVGMAAVRGSDGLIFITQDFVQTNGSAPRPIAAKKVATAAKPRVAAAPKLRVASAPKPKPATASAPSTTEVPTTIAAPTTTTTALPVQPESSVLAATAAAPTHTHEPSGPGGVALLVAFAMLSAVGTGAVRITRGRATRRA
ncbi:MAG: hypothetical protein QOJ09_3163, partial [Actinomycetota bacterium]|nr:hypothetical protein [Actinomycetota bacterium]